MFYTHWALIVSLLLYILPQTHGFMQRSMLVQLSAGSQNRLHGQKWPMVTMEYSSYSYHLPFSWACMSMGDQGGVLLGRIRGFLGETIANPNVWIGVDEITGTVIIRVNLALFHNERGS